MQVKCSNCGKEVDELDAVAFMTSKRQWLCWECYKQGQSEAIATDGYKRRKLKAIRSKEK